MKRSTMGWLIAGALVLIVIFTAIGSYNRLVTSETDAESKFAAIDVQLQRRADLIPNLVQTVKGYAAHEKEVLTAISDARARLAGAGTPEQKAAADAELTSALSRLLVVVENYPNLKADAQFTRLMDELSGTENRIAVARKDYNDAVSIYNAKLRRFPVVMYAGMFGFGKKAFFQAQKGTDTAPEVKF
ncbi:LemA family protein [Cohnella sp. CFH 77786]|uniref:LemA family protein n=1 Tax=Cohnella sp. CFH 77786 TaxID=2662265 RepID=UPI001C60B829|nr:LemA family protein [Cohnella sp. CFH 77786]MBW5446008.1 LemA family protein [Cohnella sp. CFH 77786]